MNVVGNEWCIQEEWRKFTGQQEKDVEYDMKQILRNHQLNEAKINRI